MFLVFFIAMLAVIICFALSPTVPFLAFVGALLLVAVIAWTLSGAWLSTFRPELWQERVLTGGYVSKPWRKAVALGPFAVWYHKRKKRRST